MGVLRGDDVGVDPDSRPREQFPQGTELPVLLAHVAAFLLELRRRPRYDTLAGAPGGDEGAEGSKPRRSGTDRGGAV